MFNRSFVTTLFAGMVSICAFAERAAGGPVRDVALGLGFIGFDIRGDHNPLSGGIDLSVSRNFLGDPLDFGLSELTLQGPVLFDIQTGGHLFQEVELSFRTALDTTSDARPLQFGFTSDLGSQVTSVDGSFLIDTSLKFNALGFYDLKFQSSTRQTVQRSDNGTAIARELDSDLGPIGLSGNAFADALAIVTNSLFERAGRSNPFVALSGPNSLSDLLLNPGDGDQVRLAAGENPAEEGAAFGTQKVGLGHFKLQSPPDFGPGDHPTGQDTAPGQQGRGNVIPEPTVLLLMLAGIPAVIGLRRRRRNLGAV